MMGSFDIMSDAPRKIVIYRLEDGANLDRIDTPLNNRLWLIKQFDAIQESVTSDAR